MKSLSLLIKPVSSLCNMRCSYCFYEDESKNRQQKSMGIMSGETAGLLLEKAMAYIGRGGLLSVVFQGGEPTLAGADFFASFAETAESLLPYGAQIQYSLQTNAFELSDELISVLKHYNFLVGISVDGTQKIHDYLRPDNAGRGTWHAVRANLERLLAAEVEVNALCVVTRFAARNPQKIYRSLKQMGFRYHQYIICLDPLDQPRGSMPYSLTPEAYGNFLCGIFDVWYQDWKKSDYVSVRTLEDFIHNAVGRAPSGCAAAGQCGQYLVIEADGSVYPCDFYALDEWKLGMIQDESVADLLTSGREEAFLHLRDVPLGECSSCRWKTLCRTGCRRDWEKEGDFYHNYYCKSFRMLFSYAEDRIMEIARAERTLLELYRN